MCCREHSRRRGYGPKAATSENSVWAKFREKAFPEETSPPCLRLMADPRCRIGLRMGGAAFAVSVGLLLDALVGHGEVGLPGHAVVAGYLPGRLHDVRAAEPCGGALREVLVQ